MFSALKPLTIVQIQQSSGVKHEDLVFSALEPLRKNSRDVLSSVATPADTFLAFVPTEASTVTPAAGLVSFTATLREGGACECDGAHFFARI